MQSDVICGLCSSKNLTQLMNTVRFDTKANVYKCMDCNLIFLDQNSFAYPNDFYEKAYHQTYITHVEPDALDPKKYFEKMKKASIIWADKFNKMLQGGEHVLDFGCSTGHFIELIKNKAGKVYGHDLSKKEVSFCQNELCLDVSSAPLSERFATERFDYITLIYVLEHIAEPRELLGYLKQFLNPDGKFVILVPNIQDALINFYNIPNFQKFYYCIEHLFYYNQHTIKKLFDSLGLKGDIEVIQEYPLTNHLNWCYLQQPSDTLAARQGTPNVSLMDDVPLDKWQELWGKINTMYRKFLQENGYGDRLWCVVGP